MSALHHLTLHFILTESCVCVPDDIVAKSDVGCMATDSLCVRHYKCGEIFYDSNISSQHTALDLVL